MSKIKLHSVYVLQFAFMIFVVGMLATYALQLWVPFIIVATITFVAGIIAMEAEGAQAHDAWERQYAGMSDDAKIDHHLDNARRYGSNYDANIAQALIERQKK